MCHVATTELERKSVDSRAKLPLARASIPMEYWRRVRDARAALIHRVRARAYPGRLAVRCLIRGMQYAARVLPLAAPGRRILDRRSASEGGARTAVAALASRECTTCLADVCLLPLAAQAQINRKYLPKIRDRLLASARRPSHNRSLWPAPTPGPRSSLTGQQKKAVTEAQRPSIPAV